MAFLFKKAAGYVIFILSLLWMIGAKNESSIDNTGLISVSKAIRSHRSNGPTTLAVFSSRVLADFWSPKKLFNLLFNACQKTLTTTKNEYP